MKIKSELNCDKSYIVTVFGFYDQVHKLNRKGRK